MKSNDGNILPLLTHLFATDRLFFRQQGRNRLIHQHVLFLYQFFDISEIGIEVVKQEIGPCNSMRYTLAEGGIVNA
ncbi:MAG: hypothetical protein CMI18_05095 [Opitutaceae bacterium]|nr:hypothetical protein [Opitutaceae bacterium]